MLLVHILQNIAKHALFVTLTAGSGSSLLAASCLGWPSLGFENRPLLFALALVRLGRFDVMREILREEGGTGFGPSHDYVFDVKKLTGAIFHFSFYLFLQFDFSSEYFAISGAASVLPQSILGSMPISRGSIPYSHLVLKCGAEGGSKLLQLSNLADHNPLVLMKHPLEQSTSSTSPWYQLTIGANADQPQGILC